MRFHLQHLLLNPLSLERKIGAAAVQGLTFCIFSGLSFIPLLAGLIF